MSTPRERQKTREEAAIAEYIANFHHRKWPMCNPNGQKVVDGAMRRELASPDGDMPTHRDVALAPTPELRAKLKVDLQRIVAQLSSAHRIVPRIEEATFANRVSANMVMAAKYYACLAFLADGPSGGSRYGDWEQALPVWSRNITTEQRHQCRWVFDKARFAAFGVIDRFGKPTINDQVRDTIEPILLGDAMCYTFDEVGNLLSTYRNKDSKFAAGKQEVVAVLRRLRDFFRLSDDSSQN